MNSPARPDRTASRQKAGEVTDTLGGALSAGQLSSAQHTAAADAVGNVERSKGLAEWKRRGVVIAFGVMVFGLWEVAGATGWLHPLVAPPPSQIIKTIPEVLTADYFWPNIRVTLYELTAAFVLATIVAISLAVVVTIWDIARIAILPYVISIQSVPKIVFTPIFITWFGFGPSSKIVNGLVIAFFPLFLNALSGLMQVDRDALRLLRSLTASRRQIFVKLLFPGAMPPILTGLKLCWANAVVGVVVAEFIGANAGIGYLISLFNSQLRIGRVFVLILILSVFSVAIYKLIEIAEKRICFWAYENHVRS